MLDDFAVFILSHGRPDRIYTYSTLQKAGYTGRVYIVIDNEDKTAKQYYDRYGDKVIMFDKAAIAETFDEGDNFQDRRAVIYARNACFGIADNLGIKYFMQLDDDYFTICYRVNSRFEYLDSNYSTHVKSFNRIISYLLDYYKLIPAMSLAIAQAGDYIGGMESDIVTSMNRRRKCMNTFICSTERPFHFVGRVNEDVNTYTSFQNKGNLFLTFPLLAVQQKQTQSHSGGMTEMYADSGTYIKSFYTVMYLPSAVSVGIMHSENGRLHHEIKWDNAVPCIISEKYKRDGVNRNTATV